MMPVHIVMCSRLFFLFLEVWYSITWLYPLCHLWTLDFYSSFCYNVAWLLTCFIVVTHGYLCYSWITYFCFSYSLTFTCKFKINRKQWLLSCFSSHIVSKCFLVFLLSAMFSHFVSIWGWFYCLQRPLKCRAKVPSSVPHRRKAVKGAIWRKSNNYKSHTHSWVM